LPRNSCALRWVSGGSADGLGVRAWLHAPSPSGEPAAPVIRLASSSSYVYRERVTEQVADVGILTSTNERVDSRSAAQ
jgi:hypothetical protein